MILNKLWTKVQGLMVPFVITLIGSLITAVILMGVAYKSEISKTAKLEEKVATLDATVIALNESIAIEKQKHYVLTEQRNKVTQEFNDIKRELLRHKGREGTVMAKPEMVRSMIQRSFDEFLDDVNCNTGDLTRCEK